MKIIEQQINVSSTYIVSFAYRKLILIIMQLICEFNINDVTLQETFAVITTKISSRTLKEIALICE